MTTSSTRIDIKGLHHLAFRCKDSEATRQFYEDFLGMPLSAALEISETKTGRSVNCLHTFYRLDDGSFIAFFEVPDMPFEFKQQHDFDLHVALEVDPAHLEEVRQKAQHHKMELRGVSDHGFIESIYLRDPNGYVVELTTKKPNHDAAVDPSSNDAKQILKSWQTKKNRSSRI